MNHYFDHDVYGTWDELRHHDIFKTVYTNFGDVDWRNCYFVLNYTSFIKNKELLKNFEKIVISVHFQYFNVEHLFELFESHPDQQFLLLIDQCQAVPNTVSLRTVFSNVTVLPWITWHVQIDRAVQATGLADQPAWGNKKISCLNGRQDFHKHVVAAFILKTFDQSDRVCSWQQLPTRDLYYLDPVFQCPDEFKQLLPILTDLEHPLMVDYPTIEFDNFISYMTYWKTSAFTDCVININTESVFNDRRRIGNQTVALPGPMFTEKTWKPLLAGQCFVPVAQYHSCYSLQQHGLSFDFGLDLSFDTSADEFTRLEKILRLLETVESISIDDLRAACRPVAEYNLKVIKTGHFQRSCQERNLLVLPEIYTWAAQ